MPRRTQTKPGRAGALLAAGARLTVPVAIVTSARPPWVRRLAAGPLAALAVEDSPAGVRAAVAAGATMVFADLDELVALLD